MLNFCTLFDINFATQGITMYESLKRHCDDFHLYIFAFCDESYQLLKALDLDYVTVISLKEFEDEELLRVKPTRTIGEYCWTCSSSTVKYCLEKFNLDQCTYIDADLYFYSNPKVLLDEMGENSVLLTEHRYTPKYEQTETSGKYCVQFISFKNDQRGLKALNWWRNACIDWCYERLEDGKFGDQKYLDDWTQRFEGVHVLEHLGGGVAPWNVHQYEIFVENDKMKLKETVTQKAFDVVFFHFHCIKISNSGHVDAERYNFYKIGRKKQGLIHKPYIQELIRTSKKLNKINKNILIVKKPKFKIDLKTWLKKIKQFIIQGKLGKDGYLKIFGCYIIKLK